MDTNQPVGLAKNVAIAITAAAAAAVVAIAFALSGAQDPASRAATVAAADTAATLPITIEVFDPVHQRSVEASHWAPTGNRNALVVLSHGFAGDRTSLDDSAARLNEAGFTVIAPTHPDLAGLESGVADLDPLVLRPRHVSLAINAAVERNGRSFDEVVVIGHSMGAFTALRVAGADVEVGALLDDHCATEPADEVLCSPRATPRFEQVVGMNAVDDRVTSVVLLAPAYGPLFDAASLELDPSVLVVTARDDALVSAAQTDALVGRMVEADSFDQRRHHTIDGGHFVFLRPCSAEEADAMPVACEGSELRAAAHLELIDGVVLDFLDGDAQATR